MAEGIDYRPPIDTQSVPQQQMNTNDASCSSNPQLHNSICMIVLGMAGSGKTTFVQVSE